MLVLVGYIVPVDGDVFVAVGSALCVGDSDCVGEFVHNCRHTIAPRSERNELTLALTSQHGCTATSFKNMNPVSLLITCLELERRPCLKFAQCLMHDPDHI